MNDILNQYQVQLSTPLNYPLYNKITTVDEGMSGIFAEHYTINRANTLLNGVNLVLTNDNVNDINFDSLSMTITVVTKTVTNIYKVINAYYEDESISPDFTLPTSHFQIIAQAWRDYLVTSPTTPKL